MRLGIILLLGLVFAGPVYGQQKPELPDQEPTLTNPITRENLLLLKQLHKQPELSLERGLKMAEKFIRKEKIDTRSCHLIEGKLLFAAPPQEPTWRFWWICSRDDGQTLRDIRIGVSMKGVARRLD